MGVENNVGLHFCSYSIFSFFSTLWLQNGLQMQFCVNFNVLFYLAAVNGLQLKMMNYILG